MTPKTFDEIEREIAALIAIKPHVRMKTPTGDDNRAAIDAQIAVLRARMTAEQVYERFGDPSSLLSGDDDEISDEAPGFDQHALDSALDALNWMTGDGTEQSLAAAWVL